MKKYNNGFGCCYGQSVASRIAYLQKMGVAQGIMNEVKTEVVHNRRRNLADWCLKQDSFGTTIDYFTMTVILPTKKADFLSGNYPVFHVDGNLGVIDMLSIDTEVQFHFMKYNSESKDFENGFWHTIRESMCLEDTCTLYEYVEDIIKDIQVLELCDREKYNSTGALI